MRVVCDLLVVVLLVLAHLSTLSVDASSAVPSRPALLPLWNSAFNATEINGHVQGRAACPGPAIDFAAFGIGANRLDAPYRGTTGGYNGDVVATLHYDFGMSGLVPFYLPDGTAKNGGLPQLMNMSAHLEQWRRDIERQFPDKDFSGVVSLDWEAWFPLWDVNMADARLWVYANKSRDLVRTQRPGATPAQVEVAAKAAWDAGVQRLYLQTLALAQELRPKARWGWYDYPACSWGKGPDMCSGAGLALNAELDWLWRSVDHFAPSIYLCSQHTCSSHDAAENARRTSATVSAVANISARLFGSAPGAKRPAIFPYSDYIYYDTQGLPGGKLPTFLSEADIRTSLLIPSQLGASGVVIWGSSSDGNSAARCDALAEYVKDSFGPAVRKIVEERGACAAANCSSNGQCVERFPGMGVGQQCLCFAGFDGARCEKNARSHRASKHDDVLAPIATLPSTSIQQQRRYLCQHRGRRLVRRRAADEQ